MAALQGQNYELLLFLRSDAAGTIFCAAHFCAATIRGQPTIQGQCLLLRKTSRHQRWLDKVRMSDTVTTVKRCH